jgi:GTPase SAR1 family protein
MVDHSYKIVLVGDARSGKTSFVSKLMDNVDTTKYIATFGVEVHPIKIDTTHGVFELNIYDTAGNPNYSGLKSCYYANGAAALIFYNNADEDTLVSLPTWKEELDNVSIPTIHSVGTHVDCGAEREVVVCDHHSNICTHNYSDVYNVVLSLIKDISGEDDIELLDAHVNETYIDENSEEYQSYMNELESN